MATPADKMYPASHRTSGRGGVSVRISGCAEDKIYHSEYVAIKSDER